MWKEVLTPVTIEAAGRNNSRRRASNNTGGQIVKLACYRKSYRKRARSLPVSVIAGALGGLAASYVMNQFHSAWTTVSKKSSGEPETKASGDDATVKTAKALSEHLLDHRLTEAEKKWAGPAVHYAFGTLVGAAYGVLSEVLPVSKRGYGVAYGAAVWLAADEIAVPALRLAGRSKPSMSTHIQGLTSHLVYGLTTDLTKRTIDRAVRKLS